MNALRIGVDIAQQRDKTALVAVSSYLAEGERRPQRHLDIVRIETLRPGTAYPTQVEQIVSFAEAVAGEARPVLFVDQTGVGRPLLDMLAERSPYSVRGVTIGSGVDVVSHGRDLAVPKATLVGALEVALSTRRLHCPEDLPGVDALRKELAAYSFELSEVGRPIYGGKGSHDDLVIALALAVFGSERGAPGADFLTFLGQMNRREATGPEEA